MKEKCTPCSWIQGMIAGGFFLLGLGGMIYKELHIGAHEPMLALLLLPMLLVLGLCIVLHENKYYSRALAGLAILWLVFLILFHGKMAESLAWWMNRIRNWLYLRSGSYYPDFLEAGQAFWLGFPIAIILAIFVELFLRIGKGRILAILCLAMLALLLTAKVDASIFTVLMLAGAILAMVFQRNGRGKTFLASGLLLLGIGLLFLGITLLIPSLKMTESHQRNAILEWVHSLRYESAKMAMPEGNLHNLSSWKTNDTEAMTVTMDEWSPQYLRGYVGSVYTGQSWESLSPEDTETEAELLYVLQKEGYYASSQLAFAAKALGEENSTNISIRYENCCNAWATVTYGSDTSGLLSSKKLLQEVNAKKEKGNSVQFEAYPISNAYQWMTEISNALQSGQVSDELQTYLNSEAVYREFVYQHYLDISDDTKKLLSEHGLLGSEDATTTQARKETAEAINKVLTYDETTVTSNDQDDFLEYSLNISEKGYSVHYASLAVMIFRSYGIPARYVEGYLIPESQTSHLSQGDSVHVTQKNSHAWMEFYLNGVGWIPYDPTPGHTEEIEYQLPSGEGEALESSGNLAALSSSTGSSSKEKEEENLAEEEEEENPTEDENASPLKIILLIIIFIVILIGIILILRMILLRKRLRQERAQIAGGDSKKASLLALAYIGRLMGCALDLSEEEVYQDRDGRVSQYLDLEKKELEEAFALRNEVWLSRHEVKEETRQKILSFLSLVERQYRKKAKFLKQFKDRYLTCKIY